ncbi:MAG: hypothetical protein KBS67_05400 [Bacteroidales bacterium]|nr:hypothetical protein [Candidatus Cryptobacteroides equifaecalis]
MGRRRRIKGNSYRARVREVNRIYDEHLNSGLSNREILRRYIYPVYPISESTLYNMLKAEFRLQMDRDEGPTLFDNEQLN